RPRQGRHDRGRHGDRLGSGHRREPAARVDREEQVRRAADRRAAERRPDHARDRRRGRRGDRHQGLHRRRRDPRPRALPDAGHVRQQGLPPGARRHRREDAREGRAGDARALLPCHRHEEPARHLRRDRPRREDALRGARVPGLPRALPLARVARARARARRGRARRDGAAQAPMIFWRDPTSLVALLLVPALAVEDLLAQRQRDRAGLVAFAGSAFVQCPLTLDQGAFRESLDAIDVGIIPRGGTNLGAAIAASLEAFEGRQGNHQALVLITDGESHEGDVKEAAKRAEERGVKVYTVGIGTTEGELVPAETGGYGKDRKGQVVKSRLDEETLKQIASDTGGVYLHAEGASFGLGELYRDYIGPMEKRALASTLERRFEHRFQIPLAIAFVLLLVEPLVGETRVAARRRLGW